MRRMKLQRLRWLLCGLWLALIFSQSLLPGAASQEESDSVLLVFGRVLPFLTETRVRKLAHFAEFGVLGLLLFWCFAGHWSRTLFAGLLCALCDESIQLFVPGRSAQVSDLWVDFSGVLAAAAVWCLVRALKKRRKPI